MLKTKVTSKFQTTIPEGIRERLGIAAGGEVGWHVVKEFVIMDKHEKIKNPVEFLTSQIKLDLDAVKLVKLARSDFG